MRITQPCPPTYPPDPTCSIKAAGGFLIQVLPFAEDETIEALERNISAAGSVTDMLARGMTAADISEQLLAGLGGQDTGFQLTPRWVAFGAMAWCGKPCFGLLFQSCGQAVGLQTGWLPANGGGGMFPGWRTESGLPLVPGGARIAPAAAGAAAAAVSALTACPPSDLRGCITH